MEHDGGASALAGQTAAGSVRALRSPVEVVHGVTGVAGDLVETLASAHRLLDGVLVALDLIVWRQRQERSVDNHRTPLISTVGALHTVYWQNFKWVKNLMVATY